MMNLRGTGSTFLLVGMTLGFLSEGFLSAAEKAPSTQPAILRMVVASEPPQLNSLLATDQTSNFVLGHIGEGLTRIGARGQIEPGVAESWKNTPLRFTFRLRENARWNDGKRVTAPDFVHAWRAVVDPATQSTTAFLMAPLKNAEAISKKLLAPNTLGVRALDDRTLEVELERPCAYFLGLTAASTYFPIREDALKKWGTRYGSDAELLITNGPFTLTTWVHGASLALKKNPQYWNASQVRLDGIETAAITTDLGAKFNFFKAGKTDLIEQLGRENLPLALREGFRMRAFNDGGIYFLQFNFREGRVTRNFHLRKAIALALDLEAYVQRVNGIPGTPVAHGLVPSWVPGASGRFREEFPRPAPRQDLSEAKRHLELARAELGGTIPTLHWLTTDSALAVREAEHVQTVLDRALGLKIRIDSQIFKQRLAKSKAGQFDLVSATWGPDYLDPLTFVELLKSDHGANRGKYSSPAVDEALREAQSETQAPRRMAALARAEKLGLDDVAYIPTIEKNIIWVTRPELKGVIRHQLSPDPDFSRARFEP